jgi:hypothetical protein
VAEKGDRKTGTKLARRILFVLSGQSNQFMNESNFKRGAWFTLLVVIFLFVVGIGGSLYFFTLPTDGWFAVPAPDFAGGSIIYQQNMMGAPSALQAGDQVIAVDGIPSEQQDLSPLADRWRVGETFRYTVEREGKQLDINVPLVAWQVGPALLYWIYQSNNFGFIGMVLFLIIAALAFFKRPNDHAARALFFYAALFPSLTGFLQAGQTSPVSLVFPALATVFGVMTFISYSLLYPPALLQLALVFPRPKPIVQRYPWLEYVPYIVGLAIVPFFILGIFIAGYLWTIASIVGAILLVIHSALTMRDALSRAQLGWGLWGFVLGMGMFLSNYLVTFSVITGEGVAIVNALTSLSFSVLGITLAIAVLRYRLFDIGVLVRRTLTYALVTLLLALVFFASVILLQQIFSSLTGSGQNEIVTVLSTLAIAALFIPVRNRIQTEIDKRFNRKKYDAQQVLSDFATTVRDETDLEKLTARLMQVVDETMQPKSVSVWLKKETKRQGNR